MYAGRRLTCVRTLALRLRRGLSPYPPMPAEEEEEKGGGMGKKAERKGERGISASFFFFFGGVMIHLFVTKTERKNEGRRTGPDGRAFLPPLLFSFTHGGAPLPSVIHAHQGGRRRGRAHIKLPRNRRKGKRKRRISGFLLLLFFPRWLFFEMPSSSPPLFAPRPIFD